MSSSAAMSFQIAERQLEQLGRVAILYGGSSAEREISLQSGTAVLNSLQNLGVNTVAIDTGEVGLRELGDMHIDRCFIALHGPGGEDGTLQGGLELLGIPYTGCGVLASALAMDKLRCKMLWQSIELPTPEYRTLSSTSNWSAELQALGGKVIVKPVHEGSSIGMRIANSAESLASAYSDAAQYDAEVMAERWIDGREFTVAILNGEALPVIELQTDHSFYDYDAKYLSDSTQYLCPADLDESDRSCLQKLALDAFQAIGGCGWGRVDFMSDQSGAMYLLEVNTVPGLTSHSLVPMAAQQAGISFDELIIRILMGRDFLQSERVA